MTVNLCPSVIHLCFIRVTRLDLLGNPVAGPNNFVVSDKPTVLTVTPDVLAGEVKDLKTGCDKLAVAYRGQDIVKRFNLELDTANDQPALEEILTGAPAILDLSGNVIGNQFLVPCDAVSPFVCFEAWQDLYDCDHQPAAPYPYRRYVWPASRWVRGAETEQNDITQPKFTGFTVGNPNWGLGIYGDLPEACQPNGMKFFAASLPEAAECAWQSHVIT